MRGSRVWLLTGEGTPRTYFIRSYFFVDEIESGAELGFKTKLTGSAGKAFDPMIELSDDEWFVDFKRTLGNFGFGLQSVTDARFIEGLETRSPILRVRAPTNRWTRAAGAPLATSVVRRRVL